MFQNFIDILAAPTAAFERLKTNPTFWFPLLLVMVCIASIQVGYLLLTDFNFLIDQMVDQALASNPNARERDVREAMDNLSPTVLATSAGVASMIAVPLISALYATYLNFVSKFGSPEYSFKHWFSLSCWTGIPTLFVALAAWAVILSSANGQVPQAALQPLSLDSLLALNSGKTILQNLNLPMFWSFALLTLGYRHFTGKSLSKSATITLAPYALVYGIWALASLL